MHSSTSTEKGNNRQIFILVSVFSIYQLRIKRQKRECAGPFGDFECAQSMQSTKHQECAQSMQSSKQWESLGTSRPYSKWERTGSLCDTRPAGTNKQCRWAQSALCASRHSSYYTHQVFFPNNWAPKDYQPAVFVLCGLLLDPEWTFLPQSRSRLRKILHHKLQKKISWGWNGFGYGRGESYVVTDRF